MKRKPTQWTIRDKQYVVSLRKEKRLPLKQIISLTNIPYGTVRGWLRGCPLTVEERRLLRPRKPKNIEMHKFANRKHYAANKDIYIKKAREQVLIKRKLVNEIKSVPCLDCGRSFPPCCMDFDHVRGEKSFNVSTARHKESFKKLLAEISKCDIVCSNCHRIRTFMRSQSGCVTQQKECQPPKLEVASAILAAPTKL